MLFCYVLLYLFFLYLITKENKLIIIIIIIIHMGLSAWPRLAIEYKAGYESSIIIIIVNTCEC